MLGKHQSPDRKPCKVHIAIVTPRRVATVESLFRFLDDRGQRRPASASPAASDVHASETRRGVAYEHLELRCR
ncbi:hypothetical protein NL676_025890 [Syzygium grande]|nr:hypothetical protein NL676_025890 [Syzygium grande]